MLELTKLARSRQTPDALLTLAFDVRQKSRFRAKLDDGREVYVRLPRGSVLCDGDVLEGDGFAVGVQAALESVSVATAGDSLLLTRAAYHLGNRHVPLEISVDHLVYQHDHVLDAMLRELGVDVRAAELKFQPEAGAYSQAGSHGHEHEHEHEH